MSDTVKYVLDETRLPEAWYNLAADLPEPPPPVLHPGTGQPVGPDDLAPLFPMQIILQEVATDRYIAIPEEVRSVYRQWRPTPLYRARRLEKALDTPARIYYKYEGVSPAGSHKPNTAVAQAFYNKQEGVTRLTTETGAGQWGSALAFAGARLRARGGRLHGQGVVRPEAVPARADRGVRRARRREPFGRDELGARDPRRAARLLGQPRNRDLGGGRSGGHERGHEVLARVGAEPRPHAPDRHRAGGERPARAGRGLPGHRHRLHRRRLELLGHLLPVHRRALRDQSEVRVIAVEPAACPSLTQGLYAYDFGDTGHLTPLVKMHTLGSTFIPPPFHAGGLRYHGMAPLVSHLKELGLIEARAYTQTEVFAAGVEFARVEGILPAPEANHAVKAAMDEAIRCREEGVSQAILFNLCGHGHFDMQAYIDYFAGKLEDHEYPEDEVALALAGLPTVAG